MNTETRSVSSTKEKKNNNKNKKKKKERLNNFAYDFVKVTGAIPTVIALRPRILKPYGRCKVKGGFLISANHCSFLDPIVILCSFWSRRVYSLATKDLFSTKTKAFFFNCVNCIPVDKENFSLNSFHAVVRRLKGGKVVAIFPEGQINVGSADMSAFKSGAILMANTANVPIVPLYIAPPRKWYHRRVTVLGSPVDVRQMCGLRPSVTELDAVSKYLHERENELKEFYYSKYPEARPSEKSTEDA